MGEIHVASLGADQLSFGKTLPPRSEIVLRIREWVSGKRRDGSYWGVKFFLKKKKK